MDLIIDERKTRKIELIPVYLANNGSPAIVYGKEAEAILTRLATISKGLGTDIIIDGDRGRIKLKTSD